MRTRSGRVNIPIAVLSGSGRYARAVDLSLLEGRGVYLRAIRDRLIVIGDDLEAADNREGCEHLADIAPPLLAEPLVPINCNLETLGEARLLLPAQIPELGTINSIAVVVEGSVVRVLDPLAELLRGVVRDAHLRQELATDINVGNFVVGADVVDMTELALVEDSVESVRGIAGEKVATGRAAISVKDEGLAAIQETGELGNNFYAHD